MTKAMKHLNLNLYKLSLTWIVGALLAYLFAGCIVPQEARAQVTVEDAGGNFQTGVTFEAEVKTSGWYKFDILYPNTDPGISFTSFERKYEKKTKPYPILVEINRDHTTYHRYNYNLEGIFSLVVYDFPACDFKEDEGEEDPCISKPKGGYHVIESSNGYICPFDRTGRQCEEDYTPEGNGGNGGNGDSKLTPDAPQYLRATPGNAQVTLTWDAPYYDGGDITGYAHRYRESDKSFGFDAPEDWNDIPGETDARNYTVTGLTNGVEYTFQVRAENAHGGGTPANATVTLPEPDGGRGEVMPVNTESEEIPTELMLMGNYPNPFNPVTTIKFSLPTPSHVRITLYDMQGQEVALIHDRTHARR